MPKDISNSFNYLKVLYKELILTYISNEFIPCFTRVLVPLGNRKVLGLVVDHTIDPPETNYKLKHIIEIIDHTPIISVTLQNTIKDINVYLGVGLSTIINKTLPNIDLIRSFDNINYQVTNGTGKLTSPQHTALNKLACWPSFTNYLAKQAKIKPATLNKLIELGYCCQCPASIGTYKTNNINWTKDQLLVLNSINIESQNWYLIKGVTGSGKSMVYAELINQVISKGKQVWITVPEINLIYPMLSHLSQYTSARIGIISSQVNNIERAQIWDQLNPTQGKPSLDVLLSTRSCSLYDFHRLGMIIIDEEHDHSHKGYMDQFSIHSRTIAMIRSKHEKIPIIMGSGTPSLEALYRSKIGQYKLLTMSTAVHQKKSTSRSLINMAGKGSLLSNELITAIQAALAKGEQALIFLNKLGYGNQGSCNKCNTLQVCSMCKKSYIYSKQGYLICMPCKIKIIDQCINCGSNELTFKGTRIEKLEEIIKETFPAEKVIRLDSTVTDQGIQNIFQDIQDKKYSIIVGTNIVAKGHDFSHLTTIGILDIDHSIFSRDIYALESLSQSLTQMSGRAGRRGQDVHIIVQTSVPKLCQGVLDYEQASSFLLRQRRDLNLPPYCKSISIRCLTEQDHDPVLYTIKKELINIEEIILYDVIQGQAYRGYNHFYLQVVCPMEFARKHIIQVVQKHQDLKIWKIYLDIDPLSLFHFYE